MLLEAMRHYAAWLREDAARGYGIQDIDIPRRVVEQIERLSGSIDPGNTFVVSLPHGRTILQTMAELLLGMLRDIMAHSRHIEMQAEMAKLARYGDRKSRIENGMVVRILEGVAARYRVEYQEQLQHDLVAGVSAVFRSTYPFHAMSSSRQEISELSVNVLDLLRATTLVLLALRWHSQARADQAERAIADSLSQLGRS